MHETSLRLQTCLSPGALNYWAFIENVRVNSNTSYLHGNQLCILLLLYFAWNANGCYLTRKHFLLLINKTDIAELVVSKLQVLIKMPEFNHHGKFRMS